MSQCPTLLLLTPHLRGGGAARITRHLAGGLSTRGFSVHLACITGPPPTPATLPPAVSVHALGASRVRAATLPLLRLVRQLKPDAILSNMVHLNMLVLLMRPLFPAFSRVLVRHNGVMAATVGAYGPIARALFRQLHSRADGILCQSEAMALEFSAELGARGRLHVLPNPIDVQEIRASAAGPSQWTGPGPHLLAIGRLAPEKGFDLLLDAFLRVRAQFPHADLAIVGTGPEAGALQRLAAKLGLEPHVRFAGQVEDSAAWFPGATLFVLPSRHDAMPNALLEAAAAGLPLVATPAPGAVPALLRHRPGAWVAARIDPPALADALTAALNNVRAGLRSPHPWIEAFDAPGVFLQYDAVIRGCMRSFNS